jgi:AT hook motif
MATFLNLFTILIPIYQLFSVSISANQRSEFFLKGLDMGRPRKSVQAAQDNVTVLDVKPIRTLAPMFPAPLGFHTATLPNNPSHLCVTPFGAPNAESGGNPPGFTPGQMPSPMFLMGASGVPTPQVLKSPKMKKTVLNPTPVQIQSPPVSTGEVKKRRGRPPKTGLISPVQVETPPVSTGEVKKRRGRPRKTELIISPVQVETPPALTAELRSVEVGHA